MAIEATALTAFESVISLLCVGVVDDHIRVLVLCTAWMGRHNWWRVVLTLLDLGHAVGAQEGLIILLCANSLISSLCLAVERLCIVVVLGCEEIAPRQRYKHPSLVFSLQ